MTSISGGFSHRLSLNRHPFPYLLFDVPCFTEKKIMFSETNKDRMRQVCRFRRVMGIVAILSKSHYTR